MDKSTAYAVLGLESNASQQEIKKAYRELMQINHPDKQQNVEWKSRAEETCKRLTEAYGILSGKLEGASQSGTGESFDPLWTADAQRWWEEVKVKKWEREKKKRAAVSSVKEFLGLDETSVRLRNERYKKEADELRNRRSRLASENDRIQRRQELLEHYTHQGSESGGNVGIGCGIVIAVVVFIGIALSGSFGMAFLTAIALLIGSFFIGKSIGEGNGEEKYNQLSSRIENAVTVGDLEDIK